MKYSPYEPVEADYSQDIQSYLQKTYAYMAAALGVSFVVSLITAWCMPTLVYNPIVAIVLIVAELGVVIAFNMSIRKVSTSKAKVLFFVYAALTGISFSYLLYSYTAGSLFLTFASTAVSFLALSLLGTRKAEKVVSLGRFFVAGLIGLLVLSVIGSILQYDAFSLIIDAVGLLLFLGITAYDAARFTQAIENNGDPSMLENAVVYMAFEFYLDFINIFLRLLRLSGKRR